MYEEPMLTDTNVQAAVQEKYGAIAKAFGKTGGCSNWSLAKPCSISDPAGALTSCSRLNA
jgi:hypothetical protein